MPPPGATPRRHLHLASRFGLLPRSTFPRILFEDSFDGILLVVSEGCCDGISWEGFFSRSLVMRSCRLYPRIDSQELIPKDSFDGILLVVSEGCWNGILWVGFFSRSLVMRSCSLYLRIDSQRFFSRILLM